MKTVTMELATLNKKAFSLIEIIITVAIISVITAVGITSYTSFQQTQIAQTSVQELKNNLRKYQIKALAVEKSTSCPDEYSFYGIQANFAADSYSFTALCTNGSSEVKESFSLPDNIVIQSTGSLIFKPLSGGIESATAEPYTLNICGYGKLYTITITKSGDIRDEGVTDSC